ncbi:carboxypeptidase regulatory-like domain-containing protein [bacterium]|nr:carboxypeptidase regulatory-like domain-containing protein [bacterium]
MSPLFASFIIDGGTVTLNNSVTLEVSSGIVIGAGAVLDGGNSIINVARRWQNDGTFNCGTSTVTFYTAYSSTLTGNTTFYCLKCEIADKEIRFSALSTQTVTGVLTLDGSIGNRIKLRSTIDGTTWYIRLLSSQTASYVDVKDGNAIDYSISCSESVDSGNNNDNWIFLAPDVTAPCAISNLTALTGTANDGDVKLAWTAPGDDGTSGAVADGIYRIKAATYPVTSANFNAVADTGLYSFAIDISTSYSTQGTEHCYTMAGLNPGTTYYFGIMTRDEASNWSSTWTVSGVNSGNSDQSLDLAPSEAVASVISNSSHTINVSWSKPVPDYVDDLSKYYLYKATFSFSNITTANVVHIATVTHPTDVYNESGLVTGTTYYYRVIVYDKGDGGNGLFSEVLNSALSNEVSACPLPTDPGKVKVSVVYDSRASDNKNNYGVVDGIEDCDGKVTFDWPFIPDGGVIVNYFIRVSSDISFVTFFSSATLPAEVSTYTVSGLSRGEFYWAQVKAKNSEGTTGAGTVSDGIYINRKEINSDSSDWTGTYATVTDSVTVSGGDALWRDACGDQRSDLHTSSQFDISSFTIACDRYNLYFYFGFASTSTSGFDGRNFVQIMIDNDRTSAERVFRGRGIQSEDSYVAGSVPWEWLLEAVSGNDKFRAENSLFTNRHYGAYSEHNGNAFYEIAMPLEKLGGKEKFLNKTVNFTIATFWNAGGSDGSIGQCAADNSNIVDVISSTSTWEEVGDKVVDYYLAVTFSDTGEVTQANGITASHVPPPAEPQPDLSAPPSALDYMLYNIFVDAWSNGDTSNDDINDTNDYGGDFQGVIDKMSYFNEMGINMLWFAPVHLFGGGIWGYNLEDAYQFMGKFGGRDKYIEMAKKIKNHNLKTMIDWVPGQVGHKNAPTGKKYPHYFQDEIFGFGLRQEFAEPRAYMVNNAVWWSSFSDGFRFDNPKFWDNDDGPGRYEFSRVLRFTLDKWDPELYTMGEIPGTVGQFNEYTGSNGPMLHGAIDMASGGYKDAWDHHICAWARPGDASSRSTPNLRSGLDQQQDTGKNDKSINPVMMENHDEHRLISRYRPDWTLGAWQQRVAYMTAFLVGGPAKVFYGGEVGLEGPYGGGSDAKMDRDGNVREMLFNRATESPWNVVRDSIRRTIQAKANFAPLRGDPKKGGREWPSYTADAGDDVLICLRKWGDDRVLVLVNRSNGDRSPVDINGLPASKSWKDWLTDESDWGTDASGYLNKSGDYSPLVPSHSARILIMDGYDYVHISGSVKDSAGNPISGAVVDIDRKSHWTTTTDANGNYSLSGDLIKVLTGNRTIRAWAQGFDIVEVSTSIVISGGEYRTQNFNLPADNTAPGAPINLSGQPRKNAAMIFWTPNTEADIQTYYIYRSKTPIADGSFPAPLVEVFSPYYYDNNLDGSLDSEGRHVDILENAATYYYRIRALDRSGNKSGFSNQITVVPRPLRVTFWVDTRDSGLSVASVDIEGDALAFGDTLPQRGVNGWTPLFSNGDGTFQRTFEMDDSDFIEYKYVITTTGETRIGEGDAGYLFNDPNGTSGSELRGEIFRDAIPNVEITDEGGGKMTIANVWRYYNDRAPRIPSGISLEAVFCQITVSWTKNVEPDFDYYTVQRSTYSSTEGFSEIVRRSAAANNYVDKNLTNNNTYYYKISAKDRRGNESAYTSVYSGFPRSGDTTAPAAPSGLVARGYGADGFDGIKISWNLNSEGDLAGYNIHRSTKSGFTPSISDKLNGTLISPEKDYYTDAGISQETTYYYKLAAVDSSGNSSPSSAQLYGRLVPIVFKIDAGNINPANTEILGNTDPLYWTTASTMAKTGSVYSIAMGFISGTTIQYQFGYNNLQTKEQSFATDSGYREYLVTTASITLNQNWEENPDGISGTTAYPGAKKAYLYWDRLTTAEDLAGYNIYRNNGAGGDPGILVNPSPSDYTQPYTVTDLNQNTTYSFKILAVDSGAPALESSTWTVVSVYISSQVFVHFGVPYQAGLSSSPWGDDTRLKMFLAVMSSTQTSVWSSVDRADVTEGLREMTADKDAGTYKTVLPLLKGEYYNFLFFAETTSNPPNGLRANSQYFDTVPNTGTFIVSTSSTSIAGEQKGVFYPVGTNRDARRVIQVPGSLADNSTWYVYANFGSSPTAPTYIQAIPADEAATLYWSAPYGANWVNVKNNEPSSAGEAMKAVDVVCGGCYHIYMTTYTPGSFSSYKQTATVAGTVFSKNFTGLSNNVTYYFLMRSSDTFKAKAGEPGANIYSVLSSTVSVCPNADFIITKIRVNSNANAPWPSVGKSIAMQEGMTVSAWDSDGRSNVTPTGRSVAMAAPAGLPDELEFSASLTPGTTYNFILFAHSTYTISGLLASTTYFDTVPASGSSGMLTSTSTLTTTNHGSVRFGNVGGTGETRRIFCVPKELGSGATVYVFCNFSGTPNTSEVYAVPVNSYTIQLDWSPYGSWGTGAETSKAADVLAGGSYEIYRSSVSEAGPYILILSTSGVSELADNDRAVEGDNLGLLKEVEYFYVVVSSDAYCGDPAKAQIPNLARGGALEFSSSDGSATPRETIPVYFKVDYIGPGKKKVFTIMLAGGFKIHGAGSSAVIR